MCQCKPTPLCASFAQFTPYTSCHLRPGHSVIHITPDVSCSCCICTWPNSKRLHAPEMARGRLHVKGWRAQIRVASTSRVLQASAKSTAVIDCILRRCSSISRFAVRLDSDATRKELVIRIVAYRHTGTSRADAAVLPVLRRLFPEISKAAWVQLPADARGMGDEMVFADYCLIEDTDALKELTELSHGLASTSCFSTSESPVIQLPQAAIAVKSQANSSKIRKSAF